MVEETNCNNLGQCHTVSLPFASLLEWQVHSYL